MLYAIAGKRVQRTFSESLSASKVSAIELSKSEDSHFESLPMYIICRLRLGRILLDKQYRYSCQSLFSMAFDGLTIKSYDLYRSLDFCQVFG